MRVPASISRAMLLTFLLAALPFVVVKAQLGQVTNCTVPPTCLASPVQVPTAWFNLTFSAQSTAVASGVANYTWAASDTGDAACTFKHQGLVGFTAASSQYVDLQQATGPSSYNGQVLPLTWGGLGSGSVAQGTAGWSFEMTFRPGTLQTNNKLFTLGNGGPNNTVFVGASSTTAMNFGYYDIDPSSTYNVLWDNNTPNVINPVYLQTWYHVVGVFQVINGQDFILFDVNQEHGAEFFYVNGQLVSFSGSTFNQNNFILAETQRRLTFLGRSQIGFGAGTTYWNDPYFSGALDTFRIYDKALTNAQVQSLYTSEMAGCPISVVSNPTVADATPNIVQPASNGAIPTPFFALNFSVDPRPAAGGNTGYVWNATAPTDAGNATNLALHTGVIVFDGLGAGTTGPSWINMSASTGANGVGVVMPNWGGGNSGWSFEVVVKPANETSWSKIVDIGAIRPVSGTGCHDFGMGWHSTDKGLWWVDVIDANGVEHETVDAFGIVNPFQWYHLVVAISPPHTLTGNCDYLSYVNGQLYTSIVNVYCPPNVVRANAFLAKSGWGDTLFAGELDAFNIYSQQVSDLTVANMYRVAMLGLPVQLQPPRVSSSSAAPTAAAASSISAAPTAVATSTGTNTPSATSQVQQGTSPVTPRPSSSAPAATSALAPSAVVVTSPAVAVTSPALPVSTGVVSPATSTVSVASSSSATPVLSGAPSSTHLTITSLLIALTAALAAIFVL